MPRFVYAGPAGQVFPSYLDVAEGSTLVAEPGETYDIAQVSGLTVPNGKGGMAEVALPMPPNESWKPAVAAKKTKESD